VGRRGWRGGVVAVPVGAEPLATVPSLGLRVVREAAHPKSPDAHNLLDARDG